MTLAVARNDIEARCMQREKFLRMPAPPMFDDDRAARTRVHVHTADMASRRADPSTRTAAVRDLVAILLATLVFAAVSVWLNLGETVVSFTQPNEHYEVDEVPGVLVFLALAIALFAWRRMADVRSELARRLEAERELTSALDANRRLARQSVSIQEEERRNLARELHDEFGQYLNAIKIDAVSLRDASMAADDVQNTARSIIGIADHVQAVMRETIGRLRPAGLDELGLTAALEHCVDGWRKRMPAVHFDFATGNRIAEGDEAVNITLYRVAQEALTNVAKHAAATSVEIRLDGPSATGDTITLTVRNDGRARGAESAGTGLGIVGMRERVEALGGRLDAVPVPSGGFLLSAALPVRPRNEGMQ